jgi:hypothetical protein
VILIEIKASDVSRYLSAAKSHRGVIISKNPTINDALIRVLSITKSERRK